MMKRLDSIKEWVKKYLVWLLAIYFILSVVYQASAFWFDETAFSKIESIPIDSYCYQLRIRLPDEIPLSTPKLDGNGKPITLWAWKKQTIICPDDQITVNLSNQGDLVFINADKVETTSSFLMTLGNSEANSPRYTVFVYSPLSESKIDSLSLVVGINCCKNHTSLTFSRPVQSSFWFGVSQFFDIFLGTTVFSIIALVLSFAGYLIDETDKKREAIKSLNEKMEQLKSQKENLALAVLELSEEAGRLGKINDLINRFNMLRQPLENGNIWSATLRQDIAIKIKNVGFESDLAKLPKILSFPNDEDFNTLTSFHKLPEDNTPQSSLNIAINTFQILGFASKEKVIECLNNISDSIVNQEWLTQWYLSSKATGRYLLQQIENTQLEDKIKKWNKNHPPPPNNISSSYWLWPEKISFQVSGNKSKDLPKPPEWHQPFGPLKAEDDPRLPREERSGDKRYVKGMFWDGHDMWKKVISNASECFYMLAGMGMTSFVLMGRRERRYWGLRPSLSIYTCLTGKPNAETFWEIFEKDLGKSLILSLVEDPYWLLDSKKSFQEQISAFLLFWANGDLAYLIQGLSEAGLLNNKELVLVADVIYQAERASPYKRAFLKDILKDLRLQMAQTSMNRNSSFNIDPFQLFFWVELANDSFAQDWLEIFLIEGIKSLGVLKIFIRNDKDKTKDELGLGKLDLQLNLLKKWADNELEQLLQHRMKIVWTENEKNSQMAGIDLRIKDAQGSPQRLIQLGNEKFFGR